MAMATENEVIDVLKQCFDPEIPIDLWSLGLIYNIKISENSSGNSDVNIIMTLTTPGCSMGNVMAMDIKSKLEVNNSIDMAEVEVTFDPPWAAEMMSEEARIKLGFPAGSSKKSKSPEKEEGSWE
jgi:metal-sulfur cluster biosynthetic enzyme